MGAGIEPGIDCSERRFALDYEVESGLAGDGFDVPRAGGDCHFGDDLDQPDLTGRGNVRAAADLATVSADIDHAHNLAVFVAEERERALGLLVEFGFVRFDASVV